MARKAIGKQLGYLRRDLSYIDAMLELRGKAGKPVEFGMKLDISVVNGWTRLEYHSFLLLNLRRAVAALLRLFYWLVDLIVIFGLNNEKLLLVQ